ncbi:acyl-CoA dehydratase activase [Acidobacteriota bacterium]
MNSFIGVDLGSRTTEIIQMVGGKIQHSEIFETGHDPLPRVKDSLKYFENSLIVATGYGRHLISANFGSRRVTEIKACAVGARHLFPSCRTVLDMGGQDSKLICMDERGTVVDFEMNDRCAAGTGKFLEFMAQTFNMDIEKFIQTAQEATDFVSISSMCTVFAESEVISLITSGKPKEEIALGLHVSIATRLHATMAKISLEEDILFVGGGAKNDCLHSLLEDKLKRTIKRPAEPQMVVALGAALIASSL